MSSPVTTNLSFSFAPSDGGEFSIENWNGFVGLGSVAMSLYAKNPHTVQLFASTGEVQNLGVQATRPVPASFVQVDGEVTATVPYGADFEIMFALNEGGIPIGLPAVISRVGDTVTFSTRFWGLIRVMAHTREFTVLKYTPHKQDTLWTYGVVAGYRDGRLAICHANPIEAGRGEDEYEIYRIESKMLINGEGEWELPTGWPDKPSYPNGARPPKPKVGVVSTRIHEVGMVTERGYFYSRTFDVRNAKPYFGDNSYKPKVELVKGSGWGKLTPEMKVRAEEAMVARGKAKLI